MKQRVSAAALAAGATLAIAAVIGGAASSAQAGPPEEAVLDWNAHASDALINAPSAAIPGAGQPPQVAILHLAMVQGAVYDAVNSIDGGYQPYLAGVPRASASASRSAAVATAAHHVLVGMTLVPALSPAIVTRLDARYAESLAAIPGGSAKTDGIAVGAAAAQVMLAARATDGRFGLFRFTPGDGAGEWRPTSGVNDPFAWLARVEPFLLESASQFRSKGPHSLTSGAYAKEYNEVKQLGGNGTTTSTLRTPEQTALARFYAVNPVEMFNRAFRTLSAGEGLSLDDQARLFAMVNLAGADGLINCWDDKEFWNFWRPVTAIQNGDDDGNDKTDGDSGWASLIASPPYPDHPSGYNCVTSSFMHTAEAFFGRGKTAFDVTAVIGTPPAPVTRNYERFTDVIDDTIEARIYLGIHFRTPDVQGAEIGKDVAHWLDKNFFQPVK
jgi:hypothetical protein